MHSLTLGCASFSGLVPINALVLTCLANFRVIRGSESIPAGPRAGVTNQWPSIHTNDGADGADSDPEQGACDAGVSKGCPDGGRKL